MMQTLITDLMALSKVSSSELKYKPVDLSAVFRRVLQDLKEQIQEKKAEIQVDEPLCTVQGEEGQLYQLFQNLIDNALKFQTKDTVALIQIRSDIIDERYCEIRVDDNGIGFDEQQSERIFRTFERLHGQNAYPGTGVGLAICKRIAERHGGSITAKSKPGKGTSFIVRLPLVYD